MPRSRVASTLKQLVTMGPSSPSNVWSCEVGSAGPRRLDQRWMRVDSTIAEVVRSTPSRPPMRSISASSSPIDAAATIAIRSKGPLTECSTRTSGILPQRDFDGAAPLGRQRDQHVGAHQIGLEPRRARRRCSRRSRAGAPAAPCGSAPSCATAASLRASSAVGARAFVAQQREQRAVGGVQGWFRHFDDSVASNCRSMHRIVVSNADFASANGHADSRPPENPVPTHFSGRAPGGTRGGHERTSSSSAAARSARWSPTCWSTPCEQGGALPRHAGRPLGAACWRRPRPIRALAAPVDARARRERRRRSCARRWPAVSRC